VKKFFENKKILVTGGSGFLGKNFILNLLKFNCRIISTIHKNKSVIKSKKIKYFKCNLTSLKDCKKVTKNIDYVIMCAANSSGAEVMEKKPLVHLTPNVVMNVNMLEAAYEANIKKFLFISSNAVYPNTSKRVSEEDVNNTFFEKYYVGGWMKRFSEIVCNIYAEKIKKIMPVVIIRPGNIYGPHDKFDPKKSKVIASLIRKVVHKQNPLKVWGDGKDVKDFIYVDDFVEGSLKAMMKPKNYSIFNIASGRSVSLKKVIKIILQFSLLKNRNLINFQKNMPSMIPERKISIKFAKNELSWKPKTSLKKGIYKTIIWYKKNYAKLERN
jgi:GDP-L-fucose synthase